MIETGQQPRLAVRAVLVHAGRLLLVNAYPGAQSDLWCAPGGGVEAGASLADNLAREVFEETGLRIAAGGLCHVAQFHNPETGFHQVELYFLARLLTGDLDPDWGDPAGIVTRRQFFTAADLSAVRFKPDILPTLAFGTPPCLEPGLLEYMAR
ncbi:NUDIX domain-containing protein [Pseudoruegeria sp. SK021]|uniref:NUDIX domain-containing protein n=1 Tax=Pseudoruegeria sp. SK021 TaxID=1933035 RepID=UPI000A25AFE2|nr:NUDIX hydrolase [Pseudoruegeria sp. SK021]OSP54156.1 NUDIX hydrolase [Pseudoruegeria sp. SK021]